MRAFFPFVIGVTSVALASTLASCGSSSDNSPAPSADTQPPFPIVPNQGGPILTAPTIVTVTFAGDTLAPDLVSFGETVESSPWWSAVTKGYCSAGAGGACIGQGSPSKSVALSTAPASSYTDSTIGESSSLRQWLVSSITSGVLPSPEMATGSIASTLYVLYFPESTNIMLNGLASCVDFDGYHGSADLGSEQVAYAVVSECSGPQAGNTPPITTLENTTITASHEILEATTDPSIAQTAYYLDFTDANIAWMDIQGGGELADLCIDPFLLDQDETLETNFKVQRIWSNTQASAGLDPCNPIPSGEVYFTGFPAQSYFVMDVGSSVTFEITAYATGSMSDWTLSVQDWTDLASNTTYLDFNIEGGMTLGEGQAITVNHGSKVSVTMTLETDPTHAASHHGDGSIISFSGDAKDPTAAHFWPFAVMTPGEASDAGFDATVSTGKSEEPPRRRSQTSQMRRHPAFASPAFASPASTSPAFTSPAFTSLAKRPRALRQELAAP